MGPGVKAFLIAGEPSGDRLGADLMAQMSALTQVSYAGVGGTLMQGQGMRSLFPMDELSVMGIAEVLPKYFHLKRRIRETAEAVLEAKPDVLITIDSPDFCLRVARIVKERSQIPVVHYVAPSVWAWRPGRAAKMARYVDHVLALLPFEPPLMQAAGMNCDFVGHPIAFDPAPQSDAVAALRAQLGLNGRALLVLPGSRGSEITRMGPIFGTAAAQFGPDHLLVLAAPGKADLVRGQVARWPVPTQVIASEAGIDKLTLFAAADLALAASGTVSLELAAAGTPMVIGYDMAWLSRQIMRRAALIDTVTLVNLVSDTRVVPECLLERCQPPCLVAALRAVAADPSAQDAVMRDVMDVLGRGPGFAGVPAGRSVLAKLGALPSA